MSKIKITPKKAAEILAKHGTNVTPIQAEKILDFLTQMANIVISTTSKNAIR